MRKKIYLGIIERLKASECGIRTIGLWNNQLTEIEQETSFVMPAVFVEFEPMNYNQMAAGAKSSQCRIRLHIVNETLASPNEGEQYQNEALQVFDTIDAVVAAVSHLSGDGFNRMMHVGTMPDHAHGRIQDNIEVFTCEASDLSAATKRNYTTVTNLTVNKKAD